MAVLAAVMIAEAGGFGCCGIFQGCSVTPGAVAPFVQDSFVAAAAYVSKLAASVEVVFVAATPRADGHGFGDGLAAVYAAESDREDSSVAFDKGIAAYLSPAGFPDGAGLGVGLIVGDVGDSEPECVEHLLCIGEAYVGIDGKGASHQGNQGRVSDFEKFLAASGGPFEGPAGQVACEVFVED